jgi:hypothetical protein
MQAFKHNKNNLNKIMSTISNFVNTVTIIKGDDAVIVKNTKRAVAVHCSNCCKYAELFL